MGDKEMREAFADLRTALDQLEVGAGGSKHPGEKIAALSGAVDTLRTKVWAHLTTHQAGDLDRYLGQIRVQRATEACEDLLADLYAEALAPGTPGLDLFRGVLRELNKACKLAKA